jgi:carboxyl-terminal processing protease
MVHGSEIMNDDRFSAPGAPDPVPPATPTGWSPPGQPIPPAEPAPATPDGLAPQAAWSASPAGWNPPAQPSRRAPRGKRVVAIAAVVLAAVVVFSLGISVGQAGSTGSSTPSYSPSAGQPDWALLDEAYQLLDQHYVDPAAIDPLKLERGAIVGMADSLDDRGHTGYLTPDEVKSRDDSLSGTFVGVGAVLDEQDGSIRITRVLSNSPAERAGMKAGDELVSVDGVGVSGLTVEQVVSRVRGPEGTDVALELKSPDGTTRTLTITRAKLDLPLVSWAFAPGTKNAVIRLESFSAGAAKAVTAALKDAMGQGAEGVVLDLRGNPGGYVNEPVETASLFLEKGVVYRSVDRSGKETAHDVLGNPAAPDLPLVLLVDGQTASSAEILTGSLQDPGRARVVGTKTYGTGTVVNTYPLKDGGALTIGTERWLTPNGHAIWREGLVPDEVVALPQGATLVVPDDFANLGSGGIAGSDDAQLKAGLAALDRAKAGAQQVLDRAA